MLTKGFLWFGFSEDWALVLQNLINFSLEHIRFLYHGNRATPNILQRFLTMHTTKNGLAGIPCSWPYGNILHSPATGCQEWAVYGAKR